MGLLIAAAIAYWLFRMGGLEQIKTIFSTFTGGGIVKDATSSSSSGGGGINNNTGNNNVNQNFSSHGNNDSQQLTSINGVVTRKESHQSF